jgi:hypothetical protein
MTTQDKGFSRVSYFSHWIRQNLPDSSTSFYVTDIDFLLMNFRLKKAMMVEAKSFNAPMKKWQQSCYSKLNQWISEGIKSDPDNWTWFGTHLITFEQTNFEDGKVWFDGELTDEKSLKDWFWFVLSL